MITPFLPEIDAMLNDQQSSATKLRSLQAYRVSQLDGLEPELGVSGPAFDVDVRRFCPFVAEKEEPEALGQQHGWHA
jgi:hypothetical protein